MVYCLSRPHIIWSQFSLHCLVKMCRNLPLPGASDFGGGYEMPGHGQWMQEDQALMFATRCWELTSLDFWLLDVANYYHDIVVSGGWTPKRSGSAEKHPWLGDFLPWICKSKPNLGHPPQLFESVILCTGVCTVFLELSSNKIRIRVGLIFAALAL